MGGLGEWERNVTFAAEMKKQSITVYGASSPQVDEVFKAASREVGREVALAGFKLTSGAGRSGLMASAIDGALAEGGEAIGVIPRFMDERGWAHAGLTEKVVTPDMHSRKELMLTTAHGVIALPGGVGTLEELLEAITWRQLGLYHGNIVILNTDGYYTPLLQMLDNTISRHFMGSDHQQLWQVAATPGEAVRLATAADSHSAPFTQKIPD